MTDFFKSSSTNKPGIRPFVRALEMLNGHSYVDMAAQKEAVMNAIRAEINLATAQELITVCTP